MDKPEIKKIVFSVGGKTLELSTDEAKELKQILSDLFGGTQYVDRWHHWNYPNWTYSLSGLSGSTHTTNAYSTLTTGTSALSDTDTIYLTSNSTN